MVTFNREAHAYSLDGRALWSVTAVLKRAGYLDDLAFCGTPEHKRRGRCVHQLTMAYDLSPWTDLREPTILDPTISQTFDPEVLTFAFGTLAVWCPPTLHGYLDAYVKWRRLFAARWVHVEQPMARADLGFAGTPDRMGLFNGSPAVIEVKAGGPAKWHGYQLAGYDLLDPLPFPRRRLAVYLQPDGAFRMKAYSDPEDQQHFLRALASVRAKDIES